MEIQISGINITNDHELNRIAGTAGYGGSVRRQDDCTATLDIGTWEERLDIGIRNWEVERMLGRFVMAGFVVTVISGAGE